MKNETKLPFKEGDFIEYEADEDRRSSMEILIISEDIEKIFVTNNLGFHLYLTLPDVLTRINDGRFTVKVAS